MTEVVSVKFKSKGKVYYFDPADFKIEKGQNVIVETSKGIEFAECVRGNHSVDDSTVVPPLRPIIRIATEEDTERAIRNKEKEAEAFDICREKIKNHNLDMKLVDVEYSFDGNKILFCFTSDGRVDFRDLVKDLAATFKMRIELRQIGVRDEARLLGGLGICGKPFCCAQFLDDFQPVSIKMAKTQGLSLNPTKISGTCGRLMCCLKYEQEAYEDLVKQVPKQDSFVDTPEGKGMVTDVNLLRRKVRVKLENQNDLSLKTFDASEVTVLGGKAQRAEYLAGIADGSIVEEPKKPRIQRETKPSTEMQDPEGWIIPGLENDGLQLASIAAQKSQSKGKKPVKLDIPEELSEEQKDQKSRKHRSGRRPRGQNKNAPRTGNRSPKDSKKVSSIPPRQQTKATVQKDDAQLPRKPYHRRKGGKKPQGGGES